jgi:hypothetical protein
VALVRTNVSEERIASISRVKRISKLADDGGDMFLQNGGYESHMGSHPRRWHSS